MKKYSVLLLYPDYLSDSYGGETYLAFVEANDPRGAVNKARVEAAEVNEVVSDDQDDFFVLMVIEGHHPDVNPELRRAVL